MTDAHSPLSTFHLTGEKSGDDFIDPGEGGLRPALFSAYGDLSRLRYDYPLVLVGHANGGAAIRPLTGVVNDLLTEIAPRGISGERLRKHVLGLEDEIRALTHDGHKGTLAELWALARCNLLAQADKAGVDALTESLDKAEAALTVTGEIIDFDAEAPAKVLTHAWSVVQEQKARRFRDEVGALALKLSDILKADEMKSGTAMDAKHLKESVGASYADSFDFEALSDILAPALMDGALPERRRRRIRSVLATLEGQKFFPDDGTGTGKKGKRPAPRAYIFDHCQPALEAFNKRLPEMIELVKAMTIARLEIEGRYHDATHDRFFHRFDERFVEPDDLAAFPCHLVCLANGRAAVAEQGEIMEILASGLPIKVLVRADDILDAHSIATGRLAFGAKGSAPAAMALGLDGVFVLQSSGSALGRLADTVVAGFEHPGPALYNVFSGGGAASSVSAKNAPGTPPYLTAAAAAESRAFAGFVRDPGRGGNWAARFRLVGNPQPDTDWPVHRLEYEDDNRQRLADDVAFTFADFAVVDDRHAQRFACVPRAGWTDAMVPLIEYLDLDDDAAGDKVPFVLVLDDNDVLYRAVVEVSLVEATRRCRAMWRSLQELGGINNSHADAAVAHERESWEAEKEAEIAALREEAEKKAAVRPAPAAVPEAAGAVPETAPAPTAGAASAPLPEAAPEAAETPVAEIKAEPGDPYIETPRCTTCDECTQINNRMFAYNDNKQAYIADPTAGTFRELVRAAESCQVAIIHPGKPLNPDEPGLDDLIARAEPFN